MRVIKFRAWVPEGCGWKGEALKMYTDFDLTDIEAGREECNINAKNGRISEPEWDKIKIMQFTGLKDKNERDIYEGDILLNFGLFKRQCKFIDGAFGYDADANMGFISYQSNGFNLGLKNGKLMKCEVIGNIYQSPELLNEN